MSVEGNWIIVAAGLTGQRRMNRLGTSQYLRPSRDIPPIESRERLEYNARLMNSPDVPFNLYDYFFGSSGLGNLANNDAIHFRGGRFTYNELRDYVDLWAKRLVSAGVRKGDRTAVLLFDSPEFVASFLASASIGAICVPINTFLQADEIGFILRDSGAKLIVSESDLAQRLENTEQPVALLDSKTREYIAPPNADTGLREQSQLTASSPAFLLYTSGSTGVPKGVLHRHGGIPATVESYSKTVLRLSAADRIYSASRLYFAYGLGNSLSFPLAAGASVILDDERPTADRVAKIFERERPSVFFGVPALYNALLEFKARGEKLDTGSLRLCVSAGEALPARIFEEWNRAFGLSILDGIGSTEMLHIFISNHAGDEQAGSTGKVVKGYEARLLDDQDHELAGEQTGNLWIRGESATSGYWERPDLTEAAIREGWVKTGDVYRRDKDSRFYHLGRSDDCFKVNGLWVSPIEVEAALLSHADVVEAAVVPDINARGLATARAFAVIRQGCAPESFAGELRSYLRSVLAPYKVPSRIDFIKELPRTSTGKVQRFKLKEPFN